MRAILYARVSADDRHADYRNIQGQLEMGRAYAAERGYDVVAELAEDDRGASGAAFELPQLNRVRELAEQRAFDVLVVRELDRLSRSLPKQLFVEEELRRNGIVIEYVLGEYSETPEGQLQKNIRAVIAEYERLKIVERTQRGRRQKAAAGHVLVQQRPPLGYKSEIADGGKQTLVVVPEEAALVRRIFEDYANGMSVRGLQLALSEEHVPTPGDKRANGKQREFGVWANSTLHHILRNETYRGTWHYGKRNSRQQANDPSTWVAVSVSPIIDEELWQRVQERLRTAGALSARSLKHEYLLRRRLYCGLCGAKVQGSSRRGWLSYRCPAHGRHTSHRYRCDAPSFSASLVDTLVWCWVRDLLLQPATLEQALRQMQANSLQERAPERSVLESWRRRQTELAKQMQRLLDLYLNGDFDRALLDERQRQLAEQSSELAERIRSLEADLKSVDQMEAHLGDLQQFAAAVAIQLPEHERDFAFRREIVEQLDVQVVLGLENGQKVIDARCVLLPEGMRLASSTTTGAGSRGRGSWCT